MARERARTATITDERSVSPHDAKVIEQHEATIRNEIAIERAQLDREYQRLRELEAHLAERELTIYDAAVARAESDVFDQQHLRNIALSEKIARQKSGDQVVNIQPGEIEAALAKWGATDDVFRLAFAYKERPEAEAALVLLYRGNLRSNAASAKRAARESVIEALTAQKMAEADAEYAAMLETQRKLES